MRLYYNELQQAEADILLGNHRDELQSLNVIVGELRDRFNYHVDGETNILEEGLEVLRFGLVENGGFVRHSELTLQQRQHMMVQERANMVMHDARRHMPDETDETAAAAVPTAMAGGAATSSADPPNLGFQNPYVGGNQVAEEENSEEETATNDEMEVDTTTNPTVTLDKLLENLRKHQNECLATERWEDAAELQTSQLAVLDAAKNGPEVIVDLVKKVKNGYKRLCRKAQHRGDYWHAENYKNYAEKFMCLMD